jgi:hypothetical protein
MIDVHQFKFKLVLLDAYFDSIKAGYSFGIKNNIRSTKGFILIPI